jgi:GTPase SAR1 family protein
MKYNAFGKILDNDNDNEIFKNEIEKELVVLTVTQILRFAWIVAVRALPFIGYKGSFNFWKASERKKHLYALFHALDVNAAILLRTDNSIFDSSTIQSAIREARNAVEAAVQAVVEPDIAFNAIRSNLASTTAARIGYSRADYASAAVLAAVATDFFAAAILDCGVHSDGNRKKKEILAVIHNDLHCVKEQKTFENHANDLYGEIWNKFQQALKDEAFEYWGKLYADIFCNSFVLDQDKLKQRLNVPKEIKDQGAFAVSRYLEDLEKQGALNINESRIIILGEKGAGKTCIARKLVNPDSAMTTEDESTAGVNTLYWKIGSDTANETINARIWDFAGHTVTHAVHQFFLSERCLYIIVYDGRSEARNRLEYWLDHMKNYGGESNALILVNKRDYHSVDIPVNSLKEQYNILDIAEFSLRDDINSLVEFRNRVALYIKNNPSWSNQKIPKNYYLVKDELETLFSKSENKTTELIPKDQFISIAQKHSITDTDQLLQDLHALGISLWYRDMEKYATLVLNPEWISDGVYKIINWVNNAKKHTISLGEFSAVFNTCLERYPIDKHEFLFDLMKHYELAYEIKCEKRLVIPHLLKEDRPAQLPEFQLGEGLLLRYRTEQPLPPNTISRFIVRHNEQIHCENNEYRVWRYGVVLHDGNGSIALVREEKQMISVSVKGAAKTEYISTLRDTLNDIFSSYKSKKPDLEYRIQRFGEIPEYIEEQNPIWLPDRKIFNHALDNQPYYEDITRQNIPMAHTVNIYNIKAENLMQGGTGNYFLNDQSVTTFNFYDCNIGLQSNLNDLAQLLKENGNTEEAKELENTSKALEQIEQCENKDEVKKKGIANRLKRIIDEFSDEKSTLNKTVKGIKNGISIAQAIGKGYNDIAQWVGLPQVPKPFLGKK